MRDVPGCTFIDRLSYVLLVASAYAIGASSLVKRWRNE